VFCGIYQKHTYSAKCGIRLVSNVSCVHAVIQLLQNSNLHDDDDDDDNDNIPSFRRRTYGFHKNPPSDSVLGISLLLCPSLFNSFGLFEHRSSPCIPRSPPAPFALGVTPYGLPGYVDGQYLHARFKNDNIRTQSNIQNV
jgi:hypothetical protein